MKNKNIVILGSGFGGLRAARNIAKKLKNHPEFKIILIDKNSYQTYTPSLYEVATAYRGSSLRIKADEKEFKAKLAGSASFGIRDIIKDTSITFIQNEVVDINLSAKAVITKSHDAIDYEYCIIALGSVVSFFGIENLQVCCTLKTISDALRIRQDIEIIYRKAFESKRDKISIVVIGAGLSGFEVATECAKYIDHLKKSTKNLQVPGVDIYLIESGGEILKEAPRAMIKRAMKRLSKLKVRVLLNSKIIKIEPHNVIISDGRKLSADFTIWGGGIKGLELFKKISGIMLNESGRILVDDYLKIQNSDNIFAIGDGIHFKYKDGSVPATAWAAEQQADVVSKNILNAINDKPFISYKPKFPGFVSAAGGKYGIAHLYGVTISGYLAWLIKRFIDLKYILSIYKPVKGLKIWFKQFDLWTRND